MKCLFGLVLESREWILFLDISLASDHLKYVVEDIGKGGKWQGKHLDLLKVCFLLDREGEESETSLTRLSQKLKEKLNDVRDWDSLLHSEFCALTLSNKFQAVRFKYPLSHLLLPCLMLWSCWHEPSCSQSKGTKGDGLIYTQMRMLALNWRGFTSYEWAKAYLWKQADGNPYQLAKMC